MRVIRTPSPGGHNEPSCLHRHDRRAPAAVRARLGELDGGAVVLRTPEDGLAPSATERVLREGGHRRLPSGRDDPFPGLAQRGKLLRIWHIGAR